jgi:hypothetical protein
MHCANGGDYLHRHLAMPRCGELPSELTDRILGIYMAYLLMNLRAFELSISPGHLLQNFV